MTTLELYDCTLREGEQAAGASFSPLDRKKLFSLLDDFGFNFIELGWPVASEEIFNSFAHCRELRKNAKIVAFGSTSFSENLERDKNLDSILRSGADYACIFGKTHLDHVVKQLKLTPSQNLERIAASVNFLKLRMPVFYDAEHFFDGFKENPEYALQTLASAASGGAERLILCDTNGGVLPNEAKEIVSAAHKFLSDSGINAGLGLHFHDDCRLALANVLSSLPYVVQVQGTINGIGERVGNLNFSEFVPVYMNKLKQPLNVKLNTLKQVNEQSYNLAGLEIPEVRAYVGDSAFAHKGGVHIDATAKDANYEHDDPASVGNERVILLTSLGGTAAVTTVAKKFGYNLDKHEPKTIETVAKLFENIRELEQKGYRLGALEAEQYLLVEKYFGNLQNFITLRGARVETQTLDDRETSRVSMLGKVKGFTPDLTSQERGYELSRDISKIDFSGASLEKSLLDDEYVFVGRPVEGGPVDAAYKTFVNILSQKYPEVKELALVDFHVGIAKRKGEESTVRTIVTFQDGIKFKTVGVDKNIIQSTVEALTKGFNYYLNRRYNAK